MTQFNWFTNWGLWMTTILFDLLVIAHMFNADYTAEIKPFVMWKWCVCIH